MGSEIQLSNTPIPTTADVGSQTKRIGLSDLLWLIAFVAVFLQFAFQSVGLKDYLLPAAVLAAFVYVGMRITPTGPKAFILALVFVLFLMGLLPNWFTVAYSVLLCASALLRSKGDGFYRLRWHTCLLLIALVVGNVLNWVSPPWRLERLYEARQKYPIVDLSSRLSDLRSAIPVSATVDQRQDLTQLSEVYSGVSHRQNHLERIHSQAYEDFVKRQGFGAARVLPVGSWLVKVPELEEIPFRAAEHSQRGRDADSENDGRNFNLGLNEHPLLSIKESDSLDFQSYNQKSFANFALPATLGFVSKPKHSMGFESHGFRFAMPKLSVAPHPNAGPLGFNSWEMVLNRLELVSLLNFETPRVYVLDHLPRMDQLRGADLVTRELDSFEQRGIDRLIAGDSLVSERSSTNFRMIGAIPAVNQCLQCHEGKVGDLLGAFSYEFK